MIAAYVAGYTIIAAAKLVVDCQVVTQQSDATLLYMYDGI